MIPWALRGNLKITKTNRNPQYYFPTTNQYLIKCIAIGLIYCPKYSGILLLSRYYQNKGDMLIKKLM